MAAQVVVMGVSGCGKSTVAAELARLLGVPFVEGDSLHPPRNVELMAAGTPLTDDDRRDWLAAIGRVLQQGQGAGVVVSCSALKRAYRDQLRAAAAGTRFIFLHGSEALLATRMQQRAGHYMPPALLGSQLATLEPPAPDEAALAFDIQAPAAQIAHEAWRQLHAPSPETTTT